MSATPVPPLPTVIGPTENALRAMLLRLLAATPLSSYEQWVALNLVARHPGDDDAVVGAISDGLVIDEPDVRSLLEALEATGLLRRANGAWQMSPTGLDLLTRERGRVAAVTAHLLDGIAETDIATTVAVLDQLRTRAHERRALLP